MSLIPKGPKRGWVIVWDWVHYQGPPSQTEPRYHRWALLNPAQPVGSENPQNFCMALPVGKGDLFCAGEAWTANGDLLVVGGTTCHGPPTGSCAGIGGSRLAYLWEPPTSALATDGGFWRPIADLDTERWYPSVIALGPDLSNALTADRMMVLGGTHNEVAVNSYQVWVPPPAGQPGAGTWQLNSVSSNNTFSGPSNAFTTLHNYPRAHLLSNPNPLVV
jgi:hypothetical protein